MSGRIVIMGSGELAPGLVATHRAGIEAAGADRITLLDTPYGFQENADELTQRITDFFATSLVTPTEVAGLRTRHAGPAEVTRARARLEQARYIFAGPGSPTYALDIWRAAGVATSLVDAVGRGATVTFASAAALTLGSWTIPVYEVYKVGEEPGWAEGLGVLAAAGLAVPVVPHWDNREGGTHDTSRCYVGRRRFEALMSEVGGGAIGVDEHTAATLDLEADELVATGRGGVTLWTAEAERVLSAGERLPMAEVRSFLAAGGAGPSASSESETIDGLGEALDDADPDRIIDALAPLVEAVPPATLVRLAEGFATGAVPVGERLAPFVAILIDERTRARDASRWADADRIRDALASLGVTLSDTPDGTTWELGAANW